MLQSFWQKINNILKTRSFKLALVLLLFSSLAILLVFYFVFHQYPENLSNEYLAKTHSGIEQEVATLLKNGKEIARLPQLAQAIIKGDREVLINITSEQLSTRPIGLMSVINKEGLVLSRTKKINRIGDNFFLNAPLGRALAKTDDSLASVETNSANNYQLLLVTGHTVYKDKEKIGAITINYSTDDNFAKNFKAKYFSNKVDLAFYTKDGGIYGSSFSNENQKKLFSAYFSPNSTWIRDGLDQTFVRTSTGDLYLIRNIVFPGLESSPGGLLLFIQIKYVWLIGFIGIILPTILFILVLFILHRRAYKKEKSNIWCCPYIIIFAIFYTCSILSLYTSLFNNFPILENAVFPLYNSVLHFQPSGGVFDRHFTQKISAVLDTGDESINAIGLNISYNPKEINVESVDTENSICKHFITSEHNPATGKINLECIIPNPGFTGSNATVVDLLVKPLDNVKSASLHFNDETSVLANDGLATNVLRLASDTTLLFEDSTTLSKDKNLVVFSPSHPNPDRWYSSRRVALSWSPALEGTINEAKKTTFSGPTGTPPLYKNLIQDGVYNFIVTAKDSSGVVKAGEAIIRIDTTPPDVLELKASEDHIKPGGLVRFQASGSDSLSGLQKVFYIKINDDIFFPIGKIVYIPFPQSGIYTVTLRAYDKAGNHKDVSQKITVDSFQ